MTYDLKNVRYIYTIMPGAKNPYPPPVCTFSMRILFKEKVNLEKSSKYLPNSPSNLDLTEPNPDLT